MSKFKIGDKVRINFEDWGIINKLQDIQDHNGYLKIINVDYCDFGCRSGCDGIDYRFENDTLSEENGWCRLTDKNMEKIRLIPKPKKFKLKKS